MGLPQRYDKQSFKWCLDYKQMSARCLTSTGLRSWTKEEQMAYLDWSRAEDERVEAQVAREMGDNPLANTRRGMKEIWRRVEEDCREQEALHAVAGSADECMRYTPKPTKKVLRLHDGLSKRQSALLVQLRTEKIGLDDFLFNRRVPDATKANCLCREGRQTVSHVLLRCRKYRQLRHQELGHLPGRHDLRDIMSERKAAAKAIKFMELTEVLGQFRIESQTRQS
ncbi:hypothetical protein Purlil1_13645 [Purpureocillium lilacinum]|uniref:Uncharacterized protein n=1 Tax=Purpureocillium lilacinum TaxID=33203 RepID=A0ABR0BDF7_PURLI|nr:hypothetical protein Purlil1_13645 [Purpureocillium lilacinum]